MMDAAATLVLAKLIWASSPLPKEDGAALWASLAALAEGIHGAAPPLPKRLRRAPVNAAAAGGA